MNILLSRFIGMPTMVDFWLMVVISLVNGVVVTIMATRFLHVLQLSGYKIKGVNSWLKETKFVSVGRLLFITLLSGASLLITNVLLSEWFIYPALNYLGLIFYCIFCVVYIINLYSMPQKTPIKYTKRMNRIVGVVFVLSSLVSCGLMYISANYIPYFAAGGVVVLPVIMPVIALASHIITLPIEKLIAKKFIRKSTTKLAKQAPIVIGVTGSYGKTSVKNIIATLLSSKYKVCVSPFSYNTPLGLSKTILENLEDDDQILVAEMGARNVGDISELANMVRPSIGVITGIGNQHMATFGSIEALVKTKSELTNYVSQNNGTMIFNTDSAKAKEMFNSANCKKLEAGLNCNASIKASDITCGANGSTFTLTIGKKEYKQVTTTLLGEHNISNILVAVTVAKQLDVSDEDIIKSISKLVPTSHRLALMSSSDALIVIDDAYNGSVEGSKSALKVLSSFEGKKVVITPGLVELGAEQFNSNFEFGRSMSKVCDYVIICGVVNYEALNSGLVFGGFDQSKIIRAGSLNQAVSMLPSITSPGDVVLFENDLPDNYL